MTQPPLPLVDIREGEYFHKKGAEISRAIHSKVQFMEASLDDTRKALEGSIQSTESAVALMIALSDGNDLSAKALSVQASITKAVQLTIELRELSCIAKNLRQEYVYLLDLDKMQRYGLT